MTLEIIYLSVVGPETGGEWTALHMAGPAWTSSSLPPTAAVEEPIRSSDDITPTYQTFLPILVQLPGENPSGNIGGWFEGLGRMLAFSPYADVRPQGE
jgi:hypothetical protein